MHLLRRAAETTTPPRTGHPKIRISIDVTPQEHQRLKALAALQGQSMKEFVLGCTIGVPGVSDDLAELERVLRARLREATGAPRNSKSVADVLQARA